MFNDHDFKTVITFYEFMLLVKETPEKYILPSFHEKVRNDLLGIINNNGQFNPVYFSINASNIINK